MKFWFFAVFHLSKYFCEFFFSNFLWNFTLKNSVICYSDFSLAEFGLFTRVDRTWNQRENATVISFNLKIWVIFYDKWHKLLSNPNFLSYLLTIKISKVLAKFLWCDHHWFFWWVFFAYSHFEVIIWRDSYSIFLIL